jgi:UDP:flavonoid glycosyltransferase YjiC (YdhE family)
MSYNFLLASWGTSGNLSPLLTAGRQLHKNGHHVRVIADPSKHSEIAAANFEALSWHRAPMGNAADPTDVSDLNDWVRRALFEPTVMYAADIRDEIHRAPTDAVLSVDAVFGAVIGAEAAGVPIAMLAPHVSSRPLPGVPPISTGLSQPKTPEDYAAVAAATDQWVAQMNQFLPALNFACDHLGVAPLKGFIDLFDRADRYLLAVSRAFDFKCDVLPENVRYVGPLLDQPSWSKPWRAPWSTSTGRQRVLVSCSTGAQGQRDLFQKILDAMRLLDVEVVATAGPNVEIADLKPPGNVFLLESAPHDTVMKEVSVVITQGGHGTVSRALIHGLPLLVIPIGRDQVDNGARIEAKSAGLQLSQDATESDIATALSRLIEEPHFRDSALKLGDAMAADIDASLLVSEMESIVAARRRVEFVGARTSLVRAPLLK